MLKYFIMLLHKQLCSIPKKSEVVISLKSTTAEKVADFSVKKK